MHPVIAREAIAAKATVLNTFFIVSGIFHKDIQKTGHTEMAGLKGEIPGLEARNDEGYNSFIWAAYSFLEPTTMSW